MPKYEVTRTFVVAVEAGDEEEAVEKAPWPWESDQGGWLDADVERVNAWEEGQRVRLTDDEIDGSEKGFHVLAGQVGTITKTEPHVYPYWIDWDNGCEGWYHEDDLEAV